MLYSIIYLCFFVFAAAVAFRVIKLLTMPRHLRWELYPVAHEKGKAHYGGSYFEEFEWWKKEPQKSKLQELSIMIPEILLIKGLWEHNRKLWYFSFPFHAGLYLLFALIGLLALGAIVQANGVTVAPDGNILVSALYYLTILVGFSSLAAGLFGSIALLLNRYNDKKLKNYSAPMDFANLYFFIVAFAVGFLSWLLVDHDFAIGRTIAQGVITFEDLAINSVWVSGAVFLWAILLAYIPLTHMSHFFTKYFIYHHVRWEDEPNLRGSKVEAEINKNLNYPVSWSAPHINGDGKKTWVDVALAEGTEDEK